jgi:hypothetical protein
LRKNTLPSPKRSANKLLAGLEAPQKAAIAALLRKLQAGEKLLKTDIGLLGYPFRAMPQIKALEFFRTTKPTLASWEKDGCPRNPDGTYDLYLIHQWRLERETEKYKKADSLKDKKTMEEIEKLKLQNQEKKTQMMPYSEFIEKFKSWASSFKSFWTQITRRNAHLFVGLDQPQAEVMLEKLGRDTMERWSGN